MKTTIVKRFNFVDIMFSFRFVTVLCLVLTTVVYGSPLDNSAQPTSSSSSTAVQQKKVDETVDSNKSTISNITDIGW